MAPKRLDIPALDNADELTRMYAKYTLPEIAERLCCSLGTVRSRFKEFGIETRSGAASSYQTRIEKAAMNIRAQLAGFDKHTQAMILKPFFDDVGNMCLALDMCPICLECNGRHLSWCSVAQKERS